MSLLGITSNSQKTLEAKAIDAAHLVLLGSSRTGWEVVLREVHRPRERAFGKQLRGSSCWISAVAVAEPEAAACPIDFSSETNWTIFHGVTLRATACLFSYPSVAQAPCTAWRRSGTWAANGVHHVGLDILNYHNFQSIRCT